uniref:Uncharacterized protein n=1 Tax=Leersia perrieri TaxID=77586 RepID=A0A0D9X1Q6_9ORYZ
MLHRRAHPPPAATPSSAPPPPAAPAPAAVTGASTPPPRRRRPRSGWRWGRRRGRGRCSTWTPPCWSPGRWGASSRRPGGGSAAAPRWRSPSTRCCLSTCSGYRIATAPARIQPPPPTCRRSSSSTRRTTATATAGSRANSISHLSPKLVMCIGS